MGSGSYCRFDVMDDLEAIATTLEKGKGEIEHSMSSLTS